MIMDWTEQAPGRWFLARGSSDTYLIVQDDRGLVLARYANDATPVTAARHAALTAVRLDGAYDVVPEAAAMIIEHMKQTAQAYEAGIDVGDITAHPAWRH